MRHGTKCRRLVFVHPRYRTTPSSIWRQTSLVHCSHPDMKEKCGKCINVKYLRNLTTSTQLSILFWVFLFALVFINTRHKSWQLDFSHFQFCLLSPIHSAQTSAVLNCPLINTKLRKRNCHRPSCIRSEQDCTQGYNLQKHYQHHKSVFRFNVPCARYRRCRKAVHTNVLFAAVVCSNVCIYRA